VEQKPTQAIAARTPAQANLGTAEVRPRAHTGQSAVIHGPSIHANRTFARKHIDGERRITFGAMALSLSYT